MKSYLSPTSIFKAGARTEFRSYRTDIFDALSQTLNLSLDKYFPSKTTLKAEAKWGFKHFLHPRTAAAVSSSSAGSGTGMAMRGWRGGWKAGIEAPLVYRAESRGIQIASIGGLAAQGLGDRVGLRLTAARQWFLSGKNPFSYVEEFYMVENPTYDDFSWQGYGAGGQLTLLLPWDVEIKAGYSAGRKDFPGIEALGTEGTGLGFTRKDTRRQAEIRLEKDFARMSLFFAFTRIRNESNDPLFRWRGGFLLGGVLWRFSTGAAS